MKCTLRSKGAKDVFEVKRANFYLLPIKKTFRVLKVHVHAQCFLFK